MQQHKIEVSERFAPWIDKAVAEGFSTYNRPYAGPSQREPFALTVCSKDGSLLGALEAGLFFDWLYINRVFVADGDRSSGIGTQLMEKVHELALERGATGAYLNTYDFQARGFYEKLGYTVFGTLENAPKGHQRFFMQKVF